MNIQSKPWTKEKPPRRILAIRLQAMGDLVITLPYLQELRNTLPASVQLDLLTRKEVDSIPQNIHLFDKVYSIGGERNFKKQLLSTFSLLPKLFFRRYDIIIDLQNNILSKIVRKAVRPTAWSVFDRVSPIAAGERTRLTIEAVGLGKNKINSNFRLRDQSGGIGLLNRNGWNEKDKLIILNPAGAVATRNWNIQNYIKFAFLWLNRFPDTKFLVLGTSFITEKATLLKNELGDHLINLVTQTSPLDAFAVLQHVSLVLSEDSGLMHMAWVSGIPTIALFGSTRSDWSRPLGPHSILFDSSDLPCGNCMQSICKFGDVHCLTRYTPEFIFNHAVSLIQKKKL